MYTDIDKKYLFACYRSFYSSNLFFFSIYHKIKGSSHKEKIKHFDFLKKLPTILMKFCGFIVHSKPNTWRYPWHYFFFLSLCDHRPTQRLNQVTNLFQIRYLEFICKYF